MIKQSGFLQLFCKINSNLAGPRVALNHYQTSKPTWGLDKAECLNNFVYKTSRSSTKGSPRLLKLELKKKNSVCRRLNYKKHNKKLSDRRSKKWFNYTKKRHLKAAFLYSHYLKWRWKTKNTSSTLRSVEEKTASSNLMMRHGIRQFKKPQFRRKSDPREVKENEKCVWAYLLNQFFKVWRIYTLF